jgi:hypothetical protein
MAQRDGLRWPASGVVDRRVERHESPAASPAVRTNVGDRRENFADLLRVGNNARIDRVVARYALLLDSLPADCTKRVFRYLAEFHGILKRGIQLAPTPFHRF